MAYKKSFPKTTDKSVYPKWQEIELSPDEEREQEEKARIHNIILLKQCIDDAQQVLKEKQLPPNDMVRIAVALFEKRASHEVYWKERKAKQKFDEQ